MFSPSLQLKCIFGCTSLLWIVEWFKNSCRRCK